MEINYTPVSYQGLNRQLSKELFSKETIVKMDKLYPKSNGIVGNIPATWVQNMPIEERGELIPKLYEKLGHFISKVLPKLPGNTLQSKILTSILRKHKAINSSSSVSLKKVGKGKMGKGYKLENKSDGSTLFLKRFKKKSQRNKIFLESGHHGAEYENNVKTYLAHELKTKEDKSVFTNFHFGDVRNGYYVEEYLSRRDKIVPDQLIYGAERDAEGKIYKTLYKHGLYPKDLHDENIYLYFDKNDELSIKCFDLGGVQKSAWGKTHFSE